MDKKILTIEVGKQMEFDANIYGGIKTDIDEVIKWLVQAKEQGAKQINWDGKKDWDGDIEKIYAQAFYERIETDAECTERVNKQKQHDIKRRENEDIEERRTYEQLKKKYG